MKQVGIILGAIFGYYYFIRPVMYVVLTLRSILEGLFGTFSQPYTLAQYHADLILSRVLAAACGGLLVWLIFRFKSRASKA
jgi:hypothetical protein